MYSLHPLWCYWHLASVLFTYSSHWISTFITLGCDEALGGGKGGCGLGDPGLVEGYGYGSHLFSIYIACVEMFILINYSWTVAAVVSMPFSSLLWYNCVHQPDHGPEKAKKGAV